MKEKTKDVLAPLREAFQKLKREGKIHVNPLNPKANDGQFKQEAQAIMEEIREKVRTGEIQTDTNYLNDPFTERLKEDGSILAMNPDGRGCDPESLKNWLIGQQHTQENVKAIEALKETVQKLRKSGDLEMTDCD